MTLFRGGLPRMTVAVLTAVAAPAVAGAGCSRHAVEGSAADDRRVDEREARMASAGGDDYVLVGTHGATAFEAPPAQPIGAAGTHIGRGFGFLPSGETRSVGGRRYLRLRDGRWLAEADVRHVRPSTFSGAFLKEGPPATSTGHPRAGSEPLSFAWVVAPTTAVLTTPAIGSSTLALRPRGARLTLAGPCRDDFCPLAAGWVRSADLARPSRAPRPTAAGPRERWIDIDLASQTLIAYEGDEPVFATLVSSGIGRPGSPFDTPLGVFRIRSKHALARMDNLEHTGVEPYAYDVPLTQYFTEGKALHAAPWHDELGRPRSHGCVNLSPADARWLFAFTSPPLPAGAAEIDGTPSHPGTLVRVRRQL
jgi:hypothetical protein